MRYESDINIDRWFPISLVDSLNLNTAETGVVFGAVTCNYGFEGATAQTPYSVTTNDWKEQGGGDYWLRIGASEFTQQGLYRVRISATGCAGVVIDVDTRDFGTTQKASINTEVDTALADIKLDHLIALAETDEPVDNSIMAKLVSKSATANWSDFSNTTDSLEAIRDESDVIDGKIDNLATHGDSAWATAIGFATPTNVTDSETTIIDEIDASALKIDSILEDTGTTLPTAIGDIPTNTEFEARTLPSADYVVVGDTIDANIVSSDDIGLTTQQKADVKAYSVLQIVDGNLNLLESMKVLLALRVAKGMEKEGNTYYFLDQAGNRFAKLVYGLDSSETELL